MVTFAFRMDQESGGTAQVSYDINFWKQSRALKLSPEQIYQTLCEGGHVDGLRDLPIADIYARLQAKFPTFNPTESFLTIELQECGIEISSSPQHVRFDLRGEKIRAAINELVEIMSEFGCPMYDPQVNKRFDKRRGTQIGDTPQFQDRFSTDRRESRKQAAVQLLEKIRMERSVKSVDELTKDEAHFIELERGFWLSDDAFCREHLADNALMVFPRPVGMVGREQIVVMAETATRISPELKWAHVEINDVRVSRLSSDVTLILYHAEARHSESEPPYLVSICSVYTNQEGRWKLAFHQQTPDFTRSSSD